MLICAKLRKGIEPWPAPFSFFSIYITFGPGVSTPGPNPQTQSMRIGIVCYPTFGGSGVLATELGKALAQKNHQVHFITYQQPVRLNGFIPNIFYHEVQVPPYPLFDYPPYETALASTMVDVIRNNNLDLLHVHYAIPHASAAYIAKQILKKENKTIPVITTLHGTDI